MTRSVTIRHRRFALALAGLAVTAMVTIPAAKAAAATVKPLDITTCHVYIEGDSAGEAYCGGTPTSAFRVQIECTGASGLYYRYGPWLSAGGGVTSYASCAVNNFIVNAWYQTISS